MGAIECLTSVPEKWDGTTVSGDDQMSRHAARQASSAAACNMITITGIGDHDRLEWLITMNGIRTLPTARKSAPSATPLTSSQAWTARTVSPAR